MRFTIPEKACPGLAFRPIRKVYKIYKIVTRHSPPRALTLGGCAREVRTVA